MTIAPCRWASSATAVGSGVSTNPDIVKFDGWTRSTARARPSASGASKSAARVRLVVPTSMSFAPARRTMSGIRTPPPISTSSPRDTTMPPRPASPTASASAAALLFVTRASSAPVRATRWSSATRARAPATTGLPVHLEQHVPRRERHRRGRRPGAATAARPRLVCTMTPVALITGGGAASIGPANPSRRSTTAAARASRSGAVAPSSSSRWRSASTTSRATARTAAGSLGRSRRSRTRASTSLDAGRTRPVGRLRQRSDLHRGTWRERVGVEPTTPRRARRHRF